MTMMILTAVFALCSLLSSTQAQTILRKGGDRSLGETFLALAKNYTQSGTTGGTTTKSGSFSMEMNVSAIRPLATKIDLLCDQHGSVASKGQSGNNTVTTSYNLGCRLTAAKYDVYEKSVTDLLKAAQDASTTYSYSSDSYFDGSYPNNPSMYEAQQKALESLMAKANNIEEIMLVYSSWQNTVANYYYPSTPPTSTISVYLSQKYVYEEYPTDD